MERKFPPLCLIALSTRILDATLLGTKGGNRNSSRWGVGRGNDGLRSRVTCLTSAVRMVAIVGDIGYTYVCGRTRASLYDRRGFCTFPSTHPALRDTPPAIQHRLRSLEIFPSSRTRFVKIPEHLFSISVIFITSRNVRFCCKNVITFVENSNYINHFM